MNQPMLFSTRQAPPLVVSYGVGRDSTAMIVQLHRLGIRPDAILFANTGSEKRATYDYLPVINRWLTARGFPRVTVVRYEPDTAPYRSLEGNMMLNATLPGATFNCGSCTEKFKIRPQNKWTSRWQPAIDAWAHGQKVVKMIGFEAGEDHRLKRADAKAFSGHTSDTKDRQRYEYRYPLMDWGFDLERCKQIILDAGLPVPVKSACYFCPNQKPHEVVDLSDEERGRVMLMEICAEPYNKKIKGLWRNVRKADGRPGSITEYVLQQGLSFTPLTRLGKRVVLNPKCKKAANGGTHTFDGPHNPVSLRQLLEAAGHEVPEVVMPGGAPAAGDYEESFRDAPDDVETDAHAELVAAL